MPPFITVAVKVTCPPWHTGLAEADMVTLTGVPVFFFIVMAFDVTGFRIAQDRLEVILHVIKSSSAGKYVNTGLFVPAFTQFTFH